MKSQKKKIIFSSPYYLIIWLMISPKNFVKKSVLKIWQLVFLCCVKIKFGKLPLKWCIFIHEKKRFSTIFTSNSYYSYKMYSLWYLHHVFIILCGHNIFKRHILLPRINISMTNQSYFLPKWVLTPQRKTSYHIFKMPFFSKQFGDIMSHIIR